MNLQLHWRWKNTAKSDLKKCHKTIGSLADYLACVSRIAYKGCLPMTIIKAIGEPSWSWANTARLSIVHSLAYADTSNTCLENKWISNVNIEAYLYGNMIGVELYIFRELALGLEKGVSNGVSTTRSWLRLRLIILKSASWGGRGRPSFTIRTGSSRRSSPQMRYRTTPPDRRGCTPSL